jgi:hypothetical protein
MARKKPEVKKKNHSRRAKHVERAIRLTWVSLESHLEYTHRKDGAGFTFHKRAVRDYAEVILLLSNLY